MRLKKTPLVKLVTAASLLLAGTVETAVAGYCELPAAGDKEKAVQIVSITTYSDTGGPQIWLRRDSVDHTSNLLTAIGIDFVAPGDADIADDTVRFHYGRFDVDITHRVDQCATRDDHFEIDSTFLPLGNHRVRVDVADGKNRRASLKMEFIVRENPSQDSIPRS